MAVKCLMFESSDCVERFIETHKIHSKIIGFSAIPAVSSNTDDRFWVLIDLEKPEPEPVPQMDYLVSVSGMSMIRANK